MTETFETVISSVQDSYKIYSTCDREMNILQKLI